MNESTDYHIEESGAGEPLLLLHGFTGSSQSWQMLVTTLEQHYRVLRIDLPGHGQTPTPANPTDGTLAAIAEDLAHLLEQRNASPAHILGYSMGARLALGLAILQPLVVRSLIVESGSPGLASEAERSARRASDEALASRIEQNGIAAFVHEWEQLPLWASQQRLPTETKQQQRNQRLQNTPHGLAHSLRTIGTGIQPSFWDELPQLRMPMLLITGALDSKFSHIAHTMYQYNSRFQHHIVADTGHTVHLEEPEVVVELVLEFLGALKR